MNWESSFNQEWMRDGKRIIRTFVDLNWDDAKLAEVYAFNMDGHMRYQNPCSCILGVTLCKVLHTERGSNHVREHYFPARDLPLGDVVESGYLRISPERNDAITARRLSAILRGQMRIRDRKVKAVADIKRRMQLHRQQEWLNAFTRAGDCSATRITTYA